MSKAFTKESDDNSDDAEAALDSQAGIPKGSKNYITPKGETKLREELKRLLHTERPALVKTIEWAASNGDRSENADYIYGKRKLREMDRRIRFLTKRLEIAEVIDPCTQPLHQVVFGLKVTVKDEEGALRTIQIVGIDETEVSQGKLSWISPLAKAVLNSKIGDFVMFRSPKGEQELEIISITHPDS